MQDLCPAALKRKEQAAKKPLSKRQKAEKQTAAHGGPSGIGCSDTKGLLQESEQSERQAVVAQGPQFMDLTNDPLSELTGKDRRRALRERALEAQEQETAATAAARTSRTGRASKPTHKLR